MKGLLKMVCTIFLLLPSICRSEWVPILTGVNGEKYYFELNTYRKEGSYIYYWWMTNHITPQSDDVMSNLTYVQVDCEITTLPFNPRWKGLKFYMYKQPMAEGTAMGEYKPPDRWIYPKVNSPGQYVNLWVCDKIFKIYTFT